MTKKTYAAILVAWSLLTVLTAPTSRAADVPLPATDLRCEYLADPLGIDVARPRLSWRLDWPWRGAKQTAYRLLVASSPDLLAKDQGNLWDSGRVNSDESILVEYAGKVLASERFCYWKIQAWDEAGRPSPWSKPAIWSMGLLQPADWNAKWIGLEGGEEKSVELLAAHRASWIWLEPGAATGAPPEPRYFRRILTIPPGRQIRQAICHMTADDAFTLFVNGQEAGKSEGHANVVSVDVTARLRLGANVLAVAAVNKPGPPQNPAGLIGVLRVEFMEGDPLAVVTDGQWHASAANGAGWEKPKFDDSHWPAAAVLGAYGTAPWGRVRAGNDRRRLPARMLRKEFPVENNVVRATAYVCGLGFSEVYLNGRKLDTRVMDPTHSRYDKRAMYVTFDATNSLRKGRNAVGVILGNGRFFAPRTVVPAPTPTFGYPKLLFQMRIEFADGSSELVVSDETWKITDRGPIRANNEFDGEEYDARMEQSGWDKEGFDDSKWSPVQIVAAPGGKLIAQMLEPMRVIETLKPVAISNPRPGVYVADFGQNLYGMVRIKVKGTKGSRVAIRTTFDRHPDGMVDMGPNRSALSNDQYTLKGEGVESWAPRFRGQGTRFAEITGWPGVPTTDDLELLVVHSDLEKVGEFSCSNDLVNKVYANMRRSVRMQQRGVPMDPDRDERQAWLSVSEKTSETEGYMFNVAAFYSSFLGECRIDQRKDGCLSDAGSFWPWSQSGDPCWPAVVTTTPWSCYLMYGDRHILNENYPMMKRWLEFLEKRLDPDSIYRKGCYGDWVDAYSMDGNVSDHGATSRELLWTAYVYYNFTLVAHIADLLKQPQDAAHFRAVAEKVGAAFNKTFFDPASKTYASKTQTSYVLPLAFGLTPPEHRRAVAENLVNDILVEHTGRLSVGCVGTKWLMQTLTDIGRTDVAYTVLTQTMRPSWGYMVGKGATSIWERWDRDTRAPGMNGQSQTILAGYLGAWMYQSLGGINYDPARPGFKHIILRPQPVGDLSFVAASHKCLHGMVRSAWRIENGVFRWSVTVPANTTATVFVPTTDVVAVTEGGKPAEKAEGLRFVRAESKAVVYEVAAGDYHFAAPWSMADNPTATIPPRTYWDGRPSAKYRLDARDQGVVLRHGDGPGQCDYLGAREASVYEHDGTYYLHYDGAGPKAWLACLATSQDLVHWKKHGPALELGKPGQDDSGTAASPWTYFDGKKWHMFYVATPNVTPAPNFVPAGPYLTMKAESDGPAGPWRQRRDLVPFRTKPGAYYADCASPGHVLKHGDEYLMFFSAAKFPLRTIGIARTKDLNGAWTPDPEPALPLAEQLENSSLYFEEANKTWFLFANHVGIDHRGEYTDAVWVYWSKDLNRWAPKQKAVVLDRRNCTWSRSCIGMPSVIKVGNRLAILYDAPGRDSVDHMRRDIGLAWLPLPLCPPTDARRPAAQ